MNLGAAKNHNVHISIRSDFTCVLYHARGEFAYLLTDPGATASVIEEVVTRSFLCAFDDSDRCANRNEFVAESNKMHVGIWRVIADKHRQQWRSAAVAEAGIVIAINDVGAAQSYGSIYFVWKDGHFLEIG